GLECVESFAFGKDYAVTLEHWLSRFDSQLPQIKKLGFEIYKDDEIGLFTFIEARKIEILN
ncbi:MAG: hypothetical protein OPY09_00835, partial [Nitrosopumilus sp.]|nr:hypothetical protein [Nitrosopumilus sp.]